LNDQTQAQSGTMCLFVVVNFECDIMWGLLVVGGSFDSTQGIH